MITVFAAFCFFVRIKVYAARGRLGPDILGMLVAMQIYGLEKGVCSGVPPLVNDVQVGYPLETVGPY
jgi:hypothetical protein